jgi:hypothetical protein
MSVTANALKEYRSSTTHIMARLCTRDMAGDTDKIKYTDPTAAEATLLDCETARLGDQLSKLPNLNEMGDKIQAGLKQLLNIGAPAKQEYDIFNNLFSGPAKELKKLTQTRAELIRRYTDLVKNVRENLQNLIQRIGKSADPVSMKKSQDVVHGFGKVKAEIQVFAADIKKLSRDQRTIDYQLQELLTKMRASNHNIISGKAESEATTARPGRSSGG